MRETYCVRPLVCGREKRSAQRSFLDGLLLVASHTKRSEPASSRNTHQRGTLHAPDRDAPRPDPDDLLLMGRVLKAHGTDGEAKVAPDTDDPARFEALQTVYLGRSPDRAVPRRVEGVRHQTTKRGPLILLKLDGTDDRTAAEALRRQHVYAAEADLPPLEEDERFIHDLVGLAVVTEEGERLGTVDGVEQAPAHDVFVVAREDDDESDEPALIPGVEEFVREVDLDGGRIVVRPIEGMFE